MVSALGGEASALSTSGERSSPSRGTLGAKASKVYKYSRDKARMSQGKRTPLRPGHTASISLGCVLGGTPQRLKCTESEWTEGREGSQSHHYNRQASVIRLDLRSSTCVKTKDDQSSLPMHFKIASAQNLRAPGTGFTNPSWAGLPGGSMGTSQYLHHLWIKCLECPLASRDQAWQLLITGFSAPLLGR